MPRVSVNGIELYYEERGEGVPVLGIHGTPSSALLWENAAAELAAISRCITYDRRGFYRSGRPEPFDAVDLTDHVDDAAALLEILHSAPAVVIGRSTGGEIALYLAHRFPELVKALVLLEPAVFWMDPDALAWAMELRKSVLDAAARDPWTAAERVLRTVLGDQAWDSLPGTLKDMFAATSPAVLAEIRGEGLDLSEEQPELDAEALAELRHPTLILSAEDSPDALHRVTARLADALPHSESVTVDGGHLIYPAHPAVLEFVRRVAAEADT